MSEPVVKIEPQDKRITIRWWPCGDTMFWIAILAMAVLFAGEPDLMDTIIANWGTCECEVERGE